MPNLVSIIMPCFDSEKYISEAIVSVQNQTHQNWELIIINDFSTDKSIEIIKKFIVLNSRIKLFNLTENSGAGVARNYGLAKAKGNFIAFLDADDLWKPQKLEKQLTFMQTNNLSFTFSFYETISEDGSFVGKTIQAPKNLKYYQLFFCNYIGNLTAIYNTDILGKIPINFVRKRQDWILWLSILKKIKKVQPVQESLAYYRVRETSLSASKLNLLKYNYNVYRKFHLYSNLVSGFCMIGFLITQLFIKPFYRKKNF